MYLIYPKPMRVVYQDGLFSAISAKIAFFQNPMENVYGELKSFIDVNIGNESNSQIRFLIKPELPEQAYEIHVTTDCINIFASGEVGFFYAVKSLKQMWQNEIRCGSVFDKPDLKIRGFMFDISRNKVPTVETVKYILDIMSDLKMNHFELYVEGFSFEYKSFPQFLQDESYITVEEYQELENYANKRYIDMVPNQNGFGHMAAWLATDEYKDLAELPEGMVLWGSHRKPSTLDPSDPRSLELIKKMYQDMLPIAKSNYFNMNFDEPFELGRGKSKDICEERGIGRVYLEYALKAYDEIKKYGKQPMIWGDVLIKHDDVLDMIPKDMIFIDWGYDAEYPFETNLLKLKQANIPFMAAPGTSSWCSFLGRTDDAIATVDQACIFTKLYGGEGILMTDWGDFGHLQFLPVSLPSLVYAGLMSYRCRSGTFKQLNNYLNKYVFNDDRGIIAQTIIDLGRYYHFENNYVGNGTHAFHCFMWANHALKEKPEDQITYFKQKMRDKILSYQKYMHISFYFLKKEKEIIDSRVDQLVKDELSHSIRFVQMLLKVNIALNDEIDLGFRQDAIKDVLESKTIIIDELTRLWMMRNKKSHLDSTIGLITNFMKFVKKLQGGLNEAKN